MTSRALELASRYINRRERTVAEVREYLIKREIEAGDADAAIRELSEQGALDDERFARLFVQDKRSLEQWGSERIRRGLQARGIERELAESALAESTLTESALHPGTRLDGEPPLEGTVHGELDRALALLRRRFPSPPRERRERDRALGVLLRKGYEHELAIEALGQHCALSG